MTWSASRPRGALGGRRYPPAVLRRRRPTPIPARAQDACVRRRRSAAPGASQEPDEELRASSRRLPAQARQRPATSARPAGVDLHHPVSTPEPDEASIHLPAVEHQLCGPLLEELPGSPLELEGPAPFHLLDPGPASGVPVGGSSMERRCLCLSGHPDPADRSLWRRPPGGVPVEVPPRRVDHPHRQTRQRHEETVRPITSRPIRFRTSSTPRGLPG